ncbi:MAG: membrane-bound lytic murein transglycosylase D [Psychromonas sp.]|jgi:membrane-bound lytic murein transglycosylase D
MRNKIQDKFIMIAFLALFGLTNCNLKTEASLINRNSRTSLPINTFGLPEIPESMMFAGEKIILTDLDIKERLDRELHALAYYHSYISFSFKRANRYFSNIEEILESENIPTDLKYLTIIESNLDQATSPTGAKGFWQFMPTTGAEYGLRIDDFVDERLDIEKSSIAAAKYLKNAKQNFDSWLSVAASYNRGVQGMLNDFKQQKGNHVFDLYLNSETARYVFRMLAVKLIFENPKDFGFAPDKMELYPKVETVKIKVTTPIDTLVNWSLDKGFNYKIVKNLNPWILQKSLPKPKGFYQITLPASSKQIGVYRK